MTQRARMHESQKKYATIDSPDDAIYASIADHQNVSCMPKSSKPETGQSAAEMSKLSSDSQAHIYASIPDTRSSSDHVMSGKSKPDQGKSAEILHSAPSGSGGTLSSTNNKEKDESGYLIPNTANDKTKSISSYATSLDVMEETKTSSTDETMYQSITDHEKCFRYDQ